MLIVALVFSFSCTVFAAAPEDLVYTKDSTLKASMVKYGNLTVKSGVTLTIDKSSGFEIAGNIIVEPSARIVCSGVGKGDFTFSMCSQSSTITGMDFYFNFRTESGIELRRVAGGYETIRQMWLTHPGTMAPSFKWEPSVQAWCLTGNTNVNLSDEPIYHSQRDMDTANQFADRLHRLNLFMGSDKGYELSRQGSRVEALVMLIRLMGKEDVALSGSWAHPFSDVPGWADKYVGFAYETGLTEGVSKTQFGTGRANAQMYYTFVLRALGMTDSESGTVYERAFELIKDIGILSTENDPYEICAKNFWRSDMVVVSYRALSALTADGVTLGQKLINDGVFTQEEFDRAR